MVFCLCLHITVADGGVFMSRKNLFTAFYLPACLFMIKYLTIMGFRGAGA